ncbi:acetyl-CoA carboxylase biotin carboxylase subunit [Erysipelothrix sp. HDW6C]|uniref:acetyl-CoA carboxylase biotin carboxylase subunit n=1 Tax=Erysipelothrix sp. HDW6C TaxID=2714930 RepID=UPI00140E49F2|nr:acetyl-CoA carboxylase biotin carboxylase subunit [Erysipelothrix sp. HDW6C]
MIQKVLIANRGEIAVRIIRACRELNIKTVAVYANVDKESLHVALADEAVCIGNHKLENSYLNQNAILQAAVNTQAQAIHPGFGFLSENESFVRACERLGIKFIGPSADLIQTMGDKQTARETMIAAGVPVVPGSKDLVDTYEAAIEIAETIGYPVLIKATAGGGGKGMRVSYAPSTLKDAYNQARQEAKNAFNNSAVYIEKFVEGPRHIEVQIIGDSHGNVAHLFERECSVQRNNQKMIEEAPVQNLSSKTRQKLLDVALKAASSVGYESAGTLEFIMDKQENFYFIEMNTRIQVEHPVTEAITGVDIVKEQIRIAEGRRLSFKQKDLRVNGHAIEVRINAEDPSDSFKPMAGRIDGLHFPGGNGVRIDSFVYQGYQIQPFYDSMIAKVIVHGRTRDEAMEKAIRCLEEIDLDGLTSNVEFQLEILLNEAFQDNVYDTSLVSTLLKRG